MEPHSAPEREIDAMPTAAGQSLGDGMAGYDPPPPSARPDERSSHGAGEIGFRALAEAAPDAIVCGDAYGRITYWNSAAEKAFGHTAEEALGRPLTLIIPERFRHLHEDGMERYLATGKPKVIGRPVELAGLRKAREASPDLCVLDVMMPGLTGFEVLRELRGEECTRRIPVMLLTASLTDQEAFEGATDSSADDWMRKPFSTAEFRSRVEALLDGAA